MTAPGFRDRLLAELTELIPAEPQPSNLSSIIRTPRRRPMLIGLSAAAALATAMVIAPIDRGPSSAPAAWAVEPTANGNVTITVRRIWDLDGLERQLRANGIPAVVMAGSPDCVRWTVPYQPETPDVLVTEFDDGVGHAGYVLNPHALRPGHFIAILIYDQSSPNGIRAITIGTIVVDTDHPTCGPIRGSSPGSLPSRPVTSGR
jgi:hypothetical protein